MWLFSHVLHKLGSLERDLRSKNACVTKHRACPLLSYLLHFMQTNEKPTVMTLVFAKHAAQQYHCWRFPTFVLFIFFIWTKFLFPFLGTIVIIHLFLVFPFCKKPNSGLINHSFETLDLFQFWFRNYSCRLSSWTCSYYYYYFHFLTLIINFYMFAKKNTY